MKAHTTALANLLITSNYVWANLYEITLRSGTRILWTDSQDAVKLGADTYVPGPLISSDLITEELGLSATSIHITLSTDATDLISGYPVIPYICQGGFFNASFKITRVYGATWAAMAGGGTGSIIRFAGRMGTIVGGGGSLLDFTVDSWTILLDAQMPRNVIQPVCVHNLYDAGCTISKASKAVTGTVSSVTSAGLFTTSLSNAVGYFDLGFLVFTSGPKTGQQRTVRAYTAGGTVALVLPFPAAPVAGNAFTAYPGCDYLQGTCSGKFSNLSHFKGEPFVPATETSV
jgi:uncharacterized phage protein (TIGR02218 family)